MRLLLTGSGGALGRQLAHFLRQDHELICLYRNREPECISCTSWKIDLNDTDGLILALRRLDKFDAIVHCAAMARPIECERDIEAARRINVPKGLVQALHASGMKDCLFVHISTDQVYEGTGTMYREDDPKHPINAYGKTKLESEEYLRQNWPNHVILRSSLIYGKSIGGTGFFTDFVDRALSHYVHDGKATDFYADEYRCPIYAHDICNIVSIVLKRGVEGTLVHRTYNMGGPDRLSRSDMAYLIAEERGHPKESIRCVSSATVDRGVPSPLDISMNIERLVVDLGYVPTKFADALRILHEEEIHEAVRKRTNARVEDRPIAALFVRFSFSSMKPVILHRDKREKSMYEDFADLYAIIKTTEKLERAYVRDAVNASDYEPACQKLLAQFKTLSSSLKHTVPDVERFIQTYNLDCPLATRRLIHVGIPATLELGSAGQNERRNSAVSVAETVQHFITAMDSLKLNMVAVDQIFPILSDLLQSMHRVAQLSPDFPGKIKMKEWIGKLHTMSASDELNDSEVRQLLFELEFCYNAFMASLGPDTSLNPT